MSHKPRPPRPSTLVTRHAIPKTTSGKLQRFACRKAFLTGTFPALAERREREAHA